MMLIGLGPTIAKLAEAVEGGDNPFAQTRTVYGVGNNDWGALGPTHPADAYPRTPVKIIENVDPVELPQIACTSTGITGNVRLADNSIWTWGGDPAGTWSGRAGPIWPPAPVEEPPTGGHWAQMSQGAGWVAFLSSLGHLYTGGISGAYRLGTGSTATVPTIAKIAENIVKVACGGQFGHAIVNDGTVVSWGRNSNGQTSRGTTSGYTLTPTLVSTYAVVTDIVDLAASSYSAYALKSNGDIFATGLGGNGQQGDSSNADNTRYEMVAGGGGWRQVSAAELHVVAVKLDGTLWAWGNSGTMGRFDPDYAAYYSSPTQIGTDADWLDAYALGEGTLARKTDGRLFYCGGPLHWGDTDKQFMVQIGTLDPDDLIGNAKYSFFIARK